LPNSKRGANDKGIHEGMAVYCESKYRKNTKIHITEKVDGANVSIVNIGGEFIAFSRNGYKCEGSHYTHHIKFDLMVKEWVDSGMLSRFNLPEGERVVFESLTTPHGTLYKDAPDYVLIDWITPSGRKLWDNYDNFLSVRKVKTIYSGLIPISVEDILKVTPKKGFYGANKMEGLVYRIERAGNFDFFAKWVRHDYEELKYSKVDNF